MTVMVEKKSIGVKIRIEHTRRKNTFYIDFARHSTLVSKPMLM